MANCRTPSNLKRNREAGEEMLRILHVVDLASQLATDAFEHRHLDEPLESFVDALLDRPVRHKSLEQLSAVLSQPGWEIEEWENRRDHEHQVLLENSFNAQRAGFHGFGVQFGRPVRTYYSPTSFSFSWGYMNTVWVYAESLNEAWKLGMTWGNEMTRSEKEKAGFSEEVAHG